MTMGAVALEEVVMGSGTRQRLPCAEVNSPPITHLEPGAQTARGRWSHLPDLGYRLQGWRSPSSVKHTRL